MTDGTDWVPWYFDLLEENHELRQGFHDALELIEDLLADPFVTLVSRTWGPITKPRRFSEMEDSFWTYAAPLYVALGFDPLAAWQRNFGKVEAQVRAEHQKQTIHVFESEPRPSRGGIDL